MAAQNGSLGMVKYLCEEYAWNVNELDFGGKTCLHFACSSSTTNEKNVNSSVEVVAYLLMNKAKIIVDKEGNTAMHCCALNGDIEVRFLVYFYGGQGVFQ